MGTSVSDLWKNLKTLKQDGFLQSIQDNGFFGIGGTLDYVFNGANRRLHDIDKELPELSLEKAQGYVDKLNEARLSDDTKALPKYYNSLHDELGRGADIISRYGQENLDASYDAQELVDRWNEGRRELQAENDAIRNSTLSGRIGSFVSSSAKSLLALGGNMLLSYGISMAINEIGEAWINYSQKQEKAVETGEKALTTHQKNLEEFSNASSVVDEVGERFVKLQEGVRNGQNISLTNDEFEEYKNLASELSNVLPDLVSGYDSLGNPIINSVKSLSDLNDVLAEQKQLLSQQNINNAKDYVDAFNAQSSQLKTGNQQEQGFAQRQKLLDAMVNQINSDKVKEINTNFSDYMTQSDAFTGFQAFANDVSNSIKEFASDHPIIGGFLDKIWNAEPTTVQARNNRKLGSDFAKSFQDNNVMLDDIKSSMDVSKMSAEDMTNEMLNYNLGMKKILEDAGINLDDINQIYKDSEKLSGKEREQKLDDYNTALENANKQIAQLQKTNEAEWNAAFDNTKPLIESMLQGEDNGMNYNLLQDTTKSALSQIVNGMDVKAAQSIGLIGEDGSMDTKSIKSWADGIAQNIKSSGAEEALNDLFTLQENKNDLGFKEYSSQVDSLVNDISSKVPELSGDLLKSTSGISDSLNDLKHQRVALMNDGFSERLLNDLSNADLEILWKLNSEGMVDGIENAKQAIVDYKKGLEDNDPNKYFNAWQTAAETANEGAKYNSMLSGYEAAKKAYESGEVGTDDFKTFAAMISPTGSDDARNFAENYPKFERYFQEGKTGVENFLNDLSTLQTTTGEKMASLGDDGNWDFNVTDIDDVAQKLGIGSEMVGALFGRLRDFGIDNSIITSAEEGGTRIGELLSNLESENGRLNKLTSTTEENEQGYQTDAGDHTFGNQTSIDESRAKIEQYNQGISDTIKNTENLIDTQNDSAESRKAAAIAAVKAMNDEKKAAERAGLSEAAGTIGKEMQRFGDKYGFNAEVEANWDNDKKSENAQSMIDSAWQVFDHSGKVAEGRLNNISNEIQQIAAHGGDIAPLVNNFNDLAESAGSIQRMDELGNQFNVSDKISQVQQLAQQAALLSTKGTDASNILANMASGIQTLSSANIDVSGLVDMYNSLAKSTGSDFRMELTGEIVSVDEYTGETPTVDVTVNEEKGTEVTNEQPEPKTQIVNEEKGTDVTSEQPEPTTQEVNREVNDSETSKEPAPVTQEVDQKLNKTIELGVGENQQGGVITYESEVEKPDIPDVEGKKVTYGSEVKEPDVPDVEGKTVTYDSEVKQPEAPDVKGGTITYTLGGQDEPSAKTTTVTYTLGTQDEPNPKTTEVNYKLGSQDNPKPKTTVVNYSLGTQDDPVPKTTVVNYSLGSQAPPAPQTATVNYVGGGKGGLNGTAHALGTAFANGTIPKLSSRALAMGSLEEDATHRHEMKALASGDWRTKKSEVALTGELGRELVVCTMQPYMETYMKNFI